MPDLESEESAIKLADKLNRIDPNKNMTLANLIKHEKKKKTLNLHITTINLKSLLHL